MRRKSLVTKGSGEMLSKHVKRVLAKLSQTIRMQRSGTSPARVVAEHDDGGRHKRSFVGSSNSSKAYRWLVSRVSRPRLPCCVPTEPSCEALDRQHVQLVARA
jgi:hypothetical protein